MNINAIIRQRYIGPDVNDVIVSGLILHVGHYGTDSKPKDYVILTDIGPTGRHGQALAPAQRIQEHLEGLELVRVMGDGDE